MIYNILLIDDDEISSAVVQKTLAKEKIAKNIHVKHSANEALNYLDEIEKNHQPFPEIILLDLIMPEMSGQEFLEMFTCYQHESIKSSGVFILSSSTDDKNIRQAKEHAFVKDYFVKPFTAKNIEQLLKHHFMNRELKLPKQELKTGRIDKAGRHKPK